MLTIKKIIYVSIIAIASMFLCLSFICTAPSQEEHIDSHIIRGIDAATNFDFDEAHQDFDYVFMQDEKNPASCFYFAWLLSQMQDNYLKKDTKKISQYLKNADSLSDKILKQNEDDVDALFYKAAVNGLSAYMEGTKESWWQSAKYGQKMRNYAKQMLELQPDNSDALYFLGTYDYFADIIPSTQKLLRSLLLIPGGDKNRGLKELKEAKNYGYYTKVEAEKTLLSIYVYYENNCAEAENIAYDLIDKFPNNPSFKLTLSICAYYEKDWEQSALLLEGLPQHYDYLKKYGHASIVFEIEYWLARNYLHLEKYNEADELLLQIIADKPDEPHWIYQWAILSLAQSYDLQGDSSAAFSYYRKAMQLKDYKNSHAKIESRFKSQHPLPLSSTDY